MLDTIVGWILHVKFLTLMPKLRFGKSAALFAAYVFCYVASTMLVNRAIGLDDRKLIVVV